MAEGLNKATLIGNLGAEPELRLTQGNRAVLKFRIATTESYGTESGERKEVTHWHNIVLWGKRAEGLSKILGKGSRVYVEGRIENRSYDDKDGVKRNVSEVVASNLILLGDGGHGGEPRERSQAPRSGPTLPSRTDPFKGELPPPAPGGIDGDDEIPF